MSFLHALLFFIFGTAVIARHDPDKPKISRGRPLYSAPRPPPSLSPVRIPRDAYGYWYRCDLVDVDHPTHPYRMNDVMRIYRNNDETVGLYELSTNTEHPTFPTFVRDLRGIDALRILGGRWTRFPTHADDPQSRSKIAIAQVVDDIQFRITLINLQIPPQPQYLSHERPEGYFYFLRPPLSPDGRSFVDSGYSPPPDYLLHFGDFGLWMIPCQSQNSAAGPFPVPQDLNGFKGFWLPYPMRGRPRNRVVEAKIMDGRVITSAFNLPRQGIAPAA